MFFIDKQQFKTLGSLAGGVMLFAFGSFNQAQASEIQMGSGTMSMQAGIFGLESAIESSVNVLTLKENHANLFKSDVFYNYSLSTYKSGKFQNENNSLSTIGGGDISLPNTDYSWDGIDAQLTLGYDVFKESEFDYLALGVSLGIALPYIGNNGTGDSSSTSSTTTTVPFGTTSSVDFIASDTELTAYKIGPKLLFSKSLNPITSVYGEVSYATQRIEVKNSPLKMAYSTSGDYYSYGLGMRYMPLRTKKEIGFDSIGYFTIEPSLYFTLGVNYAELTMDKLNVDLTGMKYSVDSAKTRISSTTLNLGVGYSF
jgi:hypothetical protein